jgi:hypothetical protein
MTCQYQQRGAIHGTHNTAWAIARMPRDCEVIFGCICLLQRQQVWPREDSLSARAAMHLPGGTGAPFARKKNEGATAITGGRTAVPFLDMRLQ